MEKLGVDDSNFRNDVIQYQTGKINGKIPFSELSESGLDSNGSDLNRSNHFHMDENFAQRMEKVID